MIRDLKDTELKLKGNNGFLQPEKGEEHISDESFTAGAKKEMPKAPAQEEEGKVNKDEEIGAHLKSEQEITKQSG